MKFFSMLTIVLLALSPSMAAAQQKKATAQPMPVITPCGEVQTPEGQRVKENAAGYKRVDVSVELNHSLQNFDKPFPLQVRFIFGLEDKSPTILRDELGAVKWVSRCAHDTNRNGKFYKAGTTWMQVLGIATEGDIWEGRKGLTVRAQVWMPESVIDEEPAVYSIFKDNDYYTGSWSKNEEGTHQLVLSAPPSKVAGK